MRQPTSMKALLYPGRPTFLAAAMLAAASIAASAGDKFQGVLNPSEYTYEGILQKVAQHQISDLECIYGYEFAKHGRHPKAALSSIIVLASAA